MKYYLVGIKGTGMSSLACFLKDLGNTVIGSDVEDYYFTEEMLRKRKIEVLSFNIENIKSKYVYIIGNAFDSTNVEVNEIFKNQYEYYYYHNFIGSILDKDLICISGTHGKTTTTSFLAQILNNNSSYIIGDGTGYGTNNTNYLVLEACEYKEHFLSYNSKIALVTNVELDHPDYYKDLYQLREAFQKFVNKANILILNEDEKTTKFLKHKSIITFGFNEKSNYRIKIEKELEDGYLLSIKDQKENIIHKYEFPFYGKHLIYDFVAAIVISLVIGETPKFKELKLPKRRMTLYKFGKTTLVDDYAHHPTEIKCLEKTIRKAFPDQKINVIFEPHTYSRTFCFLNEFKEVLSLFDKVYLEKVFTSKREQLDLVKEKELNDYFSCFERFDISVLNNIKKDKKEVWIFLGAGVINKHIQKLIEQK